jgi:hypothetical protein
VIRVSLEVLALFAGARCLLLLSWAAVLLLPLVGFRSILLLPFSPISC